MVAQVLDKVLAEVGLDRKGVLTWLMEYYKDCRKDGDRARQKEAILLALSLNKINPEDNVVGVIESLGDAVGAGGQHDVGAAQLPPPPAPQEVEHSEVDESGGSKDGAPSPYQHPQSVMDMINDPLPDTTVGDGLNDDPESEEETWDD